MQNAAIEHVRWIAEWRRQGQSAESLPIASPKIRSVGIIGAGTMGTSIAAAHVMHRLPVIIHDANPAALDRARASVAAELREAGAHLAPQPFQRLLRPTADVSQAARCDLVLECVAESLPVKRRLFSQLREHLAADAVVASNTSTIPIAEMAAGFPDASRFCGLHFCHPVRERPLVELIRGPQTSDRTIAAVLAHARRIDRMPIVVRDGAGFVVNRLLFPYLGEALEMLREGVPPESIEAAAAEFGMAMGPLQMMDEIGLDTILHAAWVLSAAFPDRVVSSPLLVAMVKAGRLGRKTKAGFFSYADGAEIDAGGAAATCQVDPALADVIAPWIEASARPPQNDIGNRLVLPMLLEATRILEEGAVADPRDVDLAVLFGLGFPAAKGGLLWWADGLGARRIAGLVRSLTPGPRTVPTAMLESLAADGGKFYSVCLAGA